MSNSDLANRSSEIRNRGSTLPGCSPSVMWARLSSQRTSRSSGNWRRYSVKCWIASREPVGVGVDGRGGRWGGCTSFPRGTGCSCRSRRCRSAVTPWKKIQVKSISSATVVVGLDQGAALRQHPVRVAGPPHVVVTLRFQDEQLNALVDGQVGLGQGLVEHPDPAEADVFPARADLLQGSVRHPGRHFRDDQEKAAAIERDARLVIPRRLGIPRLEIRRGLRAGAGMAEVPRDREDPRRHQQDGQDGCQQP